jgi:hypothetical protein
VGSSTAATARAAPRAAALVGVSAPTNASTRLSDSAVAAFFS